MTLSKTESLASIALKALARDPDVRAEFYRSALLREVLWPSARRFVIAEDRHATLQALESLTGAGYAVGAEFVGEEAQNETDVELVVQEYLGLVSNVPEAMASYFQIGFDLSNVGLLLSKDLACMNLGRILSAAEARGVPVVVSMERSAWVDDILDVVLSLAPLHANLGITIQAHLHRTMADVEGLIGQVGKVRLVKGVYAEDSAVALGRGYELDQRYLTLAATLAASGTSCSFATHDPVLQRRLTEDGLADLAELEMLYGVRPDAIRAHMQAGFPTRLSTVYGTRWWLHFLHRLAEHPIGIVQALADLASADSPNVHLEYFSDQQSEMRSTS